MRTSQRVLINTIAQYSRTIINMVLSLFTVRLVLGALGQSDYGIYSLIAGIVAMLGFITNSLVATTQRFVSFYQGKENIEETKEVFNNSLVIHIVLGVFIAFCLEIITPMLFNGFLNIPAERIEAAGIVYHLVVIILLITFVAAPYRALLVAHENIVFISVVEVLNCVLKVLLVLWMTIATADKLIFYGCIMLGIQLSEFLALSIYSFWKYEECVMPRFTRVKFSYIKELASFASWRIYGTACTIGRDQGISVVLNRAFGTVINAGWGIGMQISGYTNFLASAIVNAMSPVIVKSEGAGDRDRAVWLSNVLSKMVFFLMSIIAIPCLFEIKPILNWWLNSPPDYAPMFSIMFILAMLADSLTIGLTHINNAIGKIGKYIFILNTPKFFTLVIAIILLKVGCSVIWVCACYVIIELMSSIARLFLIKQQIGLDLIQYTKNVIAKELFPLIVNIAVCYIITLLISASYRFVITFIFSAIVYIIAMYLFGLSKQEKMLVNELAKGVITKIQKKD